MWEERKGEKRRWRKRRQKGDEAEPHGPEMLQVAGDLIAGEESCVMVNLSNLDLQLINIITELCVFAWANWDWRLTATYPL